MNDIAVVSLCDVRRQYEMGSVVVRALDGVSLDIYSGEFVMIVGSSGSGKSTLMHTIGLLDRPSSGELIFEGRKTAHLDDVQISALRRHRLGYVFQQFNLLFGLSVAENVALPLAYAGIPRSKRIEDACAISRTVGLGDRLDHKPVELSGGQMQRAAIARALVSRPALILADEPTGSLDSATGSEVMNLLFNLHAQGHTVVMVTHDPHLAEQGSRLIRMVDGKVVEDRAGARSRSLIKKESTEDKKEYEGGLSWADLLGIGVREGLLAHKSRTFLTMLGIIIGVAAVMAMGAFSLGSKQKQADQIRKMGSNLVKVVDARLEDVRLTEARKKGSMGLSLADFEAVKKVLTKVRSGSVLRADQMPIAVKGRPLAGRVAGVWGEYLKVNNLQLAQGRALDRFDEQHSEAVVVLGAALAKEGDLKIGDTLHLGGHPYSVVGILESRHIKLEGLDAGSQNDPDRDALIPLQSLWVRTAERPLRSALDELQFELASENDLGPAGKVIASLLKTRHYGVEDFSLVIPMDLLRQKQESMRLLDVLTLCVACVSIVVGGIGIMNIMLATVSERTREIGLRRAVGASRKDVLQQFLTESVLISVTGAALGVLLAAAVVFVVCTSLELPIVFSFSVMSLAVVASVLTGVGFGFYPAWIAANLEPVEALRHE